MIEFKNLKFCASNNSSEIIHNFFPMNFYLKINTLQIIAITTKNLNFPKPCMTIKQLASLLTFTYDVKKKQVDTLIIDYSKSYSDGKIYVRDHAGDIQASYQVNENENLRSYLTSLTDKAEKLKKSYDSDVTLVDRYCWTCTRYEEYGDTYEGTCAAMVGGACVFADKIPFGRIICAGATVIGCYVPPYKICAEGRWNTRCPVEE
ncbi:hypothetical protein [Paenibacillus sp. S-12]|nr:hypothetical protein [Paenibacillus sp. S-12]